MAQPSRRLYLAVTLTFLLLVGVGAPLALYWRTLAAEYYLRRMADPATAPAAAEAALRRALHYDRPRVVAFWERELAEINRREPPGEAADGVTARLSLPKHIFAPAETKAGFDLELVVRDERGRPLDESALRPPALACREFLYSLGSWAKHRRAPEKWQNLPWEAHVALLHPAASGLTAPDEWRYSINESFIRPHFSGSSRIDFVSEVPAGLYRFRVGWPTYPGGPLRTNWVTVLVLPEEDAAPAPKAAEAAPDPALAPAPPRR